jgi:hypothetical protein
LEGVAASTSAQPEEAAPTRTRRFKRPGQPKPLGAARPDSIPPAVAELMLLREENAWLKAAQHRPPGVGRVIDRARALPGASPDAEDLNDDATQTLVEAHVLRESLLELCGEIQQAMARVQVVLEALSPGFADKPPADAEGRPEVPATSP